MGWSDVMRLASLNRAGQMRAHTQRWVVGLDLLYAEHKRTQSHTYIYWKHIKCTQLEWHYKKVVGWRR